MQSLAANRIVSGDYRAVKGSMMLKPTVDPLFLDTFNVTEEALMAMSMSDFLHMVLGRGFDIEVCARGAKDSTGEFSISMGPTACLRAMTQDAEEWRMY